MSGSDRDKRATSVAAYGLCGLLLLGFVVVIWAIGSLQGKQAEQRQSQPHSHAIAAKDQALERCTRGKAEALIECLYDAIEASEETARTEQDLTAQQRAAWGAMIAAFAAIVSIPIGAVGLWALWRTLRQGDNALIEARNANEITRKAALAGTRPILIFENLIVNQNQMGGWDVNFVWKNIGKGPARIVRIDTGREVEPQDGTFGLPKNRIHILHRARNRRTDYGGNIVPADGMHASTVIKVSPMVFVGDKIGATPHDVFLTGKAKYSGIVGDNESPYRTDIIIALRPVVVVEGQTMPAEIGFRGQYPLAGIDWMPVPDGTEMT